MSEEKLATNDDEENKETTVTTVATTPAAVPVGLTKSTTIEKDSKYAKQKQLETASDCTEDQDQDPVKEQHITKTIRESLTLTLAPYSSRRSLISTDRINELRRKAQDAAKHNKIFTIRGCFNSVRMALLIRGWVEKLDVHRKHIPNIQVSYDELTQKLPKRKAGETRRHYIAKCERNIMSRFLEHIPIDFLWTNRKEKCDYIDQAKNPGMIINKFHRAPFTTKEGLCNQLKDFHWYFEEGTAELYFPRCFNVWSPEELSEFIENFKLTACIAFIRFIVAQFQEHGFEGVFAPSGKIPLTALDFAFKRCTEYLESCLHHDIDGDDPPKIWEHEWDAFLYQHFQLVNENGRVQADQQRNVECVIKQGLQLLEKLEPQWPQYSLDGYQNLWIIKPANKCRGRGIVLMDSLKKILTVVNPSIASKSRYVVQKYIERPLILFHTKFDIRQWFLITNVQPLVVWVYKESYLRFSSQEYSLSNHHESVHLTNYAIQKKYTNGKRDKRLPSENMWDCYSFQAYLRQIGKHGMWQERIYPGMKKAIVGTLLASQDNMDRRPNTFELFGADFMICENFYPWLIEINSSPDLGATTSVTARMCPQCLEDVVKVVIDRRADPKIDLGNFELAYRQVVPQTPAYMGLNLYVKGKQMQHKAHNHHHDNHNQCISTRLYNHNHSLYRQRAATTTTMLSKVHRAMPVFNATEMVEKFYADPNARRSSIGATSSLLSQQLTALQYASSRSKSTVVSTVTPNAQLLMQHPKPAVERKRSITHEVRLRSMVSKAVNDATNEHIKERIRRQRSCGPRLNSAKSEPNRKPTQTTAKPGKVQRTKQNSAGTTATLSGGKSSSCSKSETSLLELLKNTKSTLCLPMNRQKGASNQDLRQSLTATAATGGSTLQAKSLSDCDTVEVDCKWRNALRNKPVTLRTPPPTIKREAGNSPRIVQQDTILESQNMHAVGKALSASTNTINVVMLPKVVTCGATVGNVTMANDLLTLKQLISPRPVRNRCAQSNN